MNTNKSISRKIAIILTAKFNRIMLKEILPIKATKDHVLIWNIWFNCSKARLLNSGQTLIMAQHSVKATKELLQQHSTSSASSSACTVVPSLLSSTSFSVSLFLNIKFYCIWIPTKAFILLQCLSSWSSLPFIVTIAFSTKESSIVMLLYTGGSLGGDWIKEQGSAS